MKRFRMLLCVLASCGCATRSLETGDTADGTCLGERQIELKMQRINQLRADVAVFRDAVRKQEAGESQLAQLDQRLGILERDKEYAAHRDAAQAYLQEFEDQLEQEIHDLLLILRGGSFDPTMREKGPHSGIQRTR
jgi:hypothetical protein